MATWQVQQAKTRFSEVIDDATTKGPQIITRHGTERAVVLSMGDYRELAARKPETATSFVEFLLSGPRLEEHDDFQEIIEQIVADRKLDTGRDIELD